MRTILTVTMIAGLLLAGCSGRPAAVKPCANASAELAPGQRKGKCPICGKEVDGNVCHTYDDKCIYFCSFACVDRFLERPAEIVKRMKAEGVALEDSSSCEHLKDKRPSDKQ